jgi:hypothetical protein
MCEWKDIVDVMCGVQWANFDEEEEIGGKEEADGMMSAVSHEPLQRGFSAIVKGGLLVGEKEIVLESKTTRACSKRVGGWVHRFHKRAPETPFR